MGSAVHEVVALRQWDIFLRNYRNRIGLWFFAAIFLAACGSTNVTSFPIPLGAESGQHTFILFYTDN